MATILCVADKLRTLRLLGVVLHSTGYRVLTVRDFATVLEMPPGRCHLVILACETTKAKPLARGLKRINPGVPILLLTKDPLSRADNLDGIDECVHGDEVIDEMLGKIRRLLETPRLGATQTVPWPQSWDRKVLPAGESGPTMRVLEQAADDEAMPRFSLSKTNGNPG